MDKELKEALQKEITNQIEEVSHIENGTEEHSGAVADLAKLLAQANEAQKIENDMCVKSDDIELKNEQLDLERSKLECENARLKEELEANKIQGWVRVVIDGLAVILPIGFYSVWMKRGLEFEREGSYTSTTFRGLMSKWKPTKR